MTAFRIRAAARSDLPRISEVRHGTAENPLRESSRATEAEVLWYLDNAVFLVGEDEAAIQGFVCANPQTGYVWALFVIDGARGRGLGTALLEAALAWLRQAGNRQAFLSTGAGTRAEGFYASRGWRAVGQNLDGNVVYRIGL